MKHFSANTHKSFLIHLGFSVHGEHVFLNNSNIVITNDLTVFYQMVSD